MHSIALLTDFGTEDWFVGTMKGVIRSINPKAGIIDITHGISPGDIRSGAFALRSCYRYCPKGTVFVAIVDPGVGSGRLPIAAESGGYMFVAPDNGILSYVLSATMDEAEKRKPRNKHKAHIRVLENHRYFLKEPSNTFHGRDIFAPVAAHLSKGIPLGDLGRKGELQVTLPLLKATLVGARLLAGILYIDHFGNAIAGVKEEDLQMLANPKPRVFIPGKGSDRGYEIRNFYAQAMPGEILGIFGSSGYLEISMYTGNAQEKLKLKVGDSLFVY